MFLNKRNFPMILFSIILLVSLTLMMKTPAKAIDYYAHAESFSLVEIIDIQHLTTEMLESRNGKLIIERVVGMVTDAEPGDGRIIGGDDYYNYISYSNVNGISNGDVICSYFIYNPDNNYVDDIIMRFDSIICTK